MQGLFMIILTLIIMPLMAMGGKQIHRLKEEQDAELDWGTKSTII